MKVVSAAEMQAMDHHTINSFGLPGRVLMENAGRGATRSFLEQLYQNDSGRVGILCGRGNNGGDGFVMARYLTQAGLDITVYLLATQDRVKGDAADNLKMMPALNIPVIEIPDSKRFLNQQSEMAQIRYWIDALLGTGLNSDVRGLFRQAIEFVNHQKRPIFAVDIPSGLNSDSGHPMGICIKADATATFGFPKIGHVIYPGAEICGTIDVIDIGIPPSVSKEIDAQQNLISAHNVQSILGQRPPEMHKGNAGHVLVVAGSTGKTGAAAMTSTSALRVGGGLVTLAVAKSLNPIMEGCLVEAMTAPLPDEEKGHLGPEAFEALAGLAQNKACLAMGPGMGTAPETIALCRRIIKEINIPLVIDADGLRYLGADAAVLLERTAPVVLTPHPGEMARLMNVSSGQIQNNRIAFARQFATQYRATVVLKGARTIIADSEGVVWINPTGNAGMAAGGMGDVLTGMIAGLIGQGCSPLAAAQVGTYLHGYTADLIQQDRPWGYLATEVMNHLPFAIGHILENPPPLPFNLPVL
jgi:NAD(P)H-hydrate epimerase